MTRAFSLVASTALAAVLALSGVTPRRTPPPPPPEPPQSLHVPPTAAIPIVSRDRFVAAPGLVWPVDRSTPITDVFGPRPDGAPCAGCLANHRGVDFSFGTYGGAIFALSRGTVVEVGGPDAGYGNYAVIEHEWRGERFQAVYAHMLPGSRSVGVGSVVEPGQTIGAIGDTGNATGPHLHLEILVDGVQIDPLAWLEARVR